MSTEPNAPRGGRLNRHELLQVGFSGVLGLGLSSVLGARRAQAKAQAPPTAKSVIFVFCTGAPAHQDIWDLKPEAPAESRGEFKPIDTESPGVQISEHLPRLAKLSRHYAIVRSMSHPLPSHEHGTHYLLTGIDKSPPGSTHMASRNDWPCYSAGVSYVRPRGDGLPSGVMLPTYLNNGYGFCGQTGGFLGSRYDPWQLTSDPNEKDFRVDHLTPQPGLSVDRLSARRELLESVDRQRRDLEASAAVHDAAQRQAEAFNLLIQGGKFRAAFELDREPAANRDRYGRHMFGQSLLLGRRLVEAGVPVVQVNLGKMNHWDTHAFNFVSLKNKLLPPFDQGLAALLTDLDERGLLDETLVVVTGEFGRTPLINDRNAGRDHWSNVFSAVFAGAGVRGGQAIGASDKQAAYPATRPWHPSDLGATIYSALGIEPDSIVVDRLGRPHQLNAGQVIAPLYS